MTVKDFIHLVCTQKEITLSQLATRMGVNEKTLHTTISRNDGMGMTVGKLAEWAEKLNMELSLYDMNNEEEYVIDGEFEDFGLE